MKRETLNVLENMVWERCRASKTTNKFRCVWQN